MQEALEARKAYKNEVRLLIYRDSEDPEKETAALRLYMDESGGDDPGTPHAVIGGMLIFRRAFLPFEDEWHRMLLQHGIPDGIHMKEFGRPHGRLAGISDCCRRELFIEATHLIRKYRAFTLAATLSNEQYRNNMPKVVRDRFSVYGMCFHLAVMTTHKLAEFNRHNDRIPFIMDGGNPYKHHVVDSHAFILKTFQKHIYIHAGGLFFDDDKVLGILQAADVIAWGTRRHASKIPFGKGFSPIEDFLKETDHHHEQAYKPEWMKQLGDSLLKLIEDGKAGREVTDEDFKEQGV